MMEAHQGTAPQPEPDTGLACLTVLASFHNVPAPPEQLANEYLDDSHLFGWAELLLAAKQFSLTVSSAQQARGFAAYFIARNSCE